MALAQIMSTNLLSLSMDDTLGHAKEVFEHHNIHHLLITDENLLAGIITDRDLHLHLSPSIGTRNETHQDSFILQKKLHLIMSRELVTASPEMSINDAVLLFHDHKVSCLPIVDEQGTPLGIITWRDIIKVLALQYRRRLQKSN